MLDKVTEHIRLGLPREIIDRIDRIAMLVPKFITWMWFIFLGGVLSVFLMAKSIEYNLFGLFGELPPLEVLERPTQPKPSELYTADSVLIGRYYSENATRVSYDEIPTVLVHALLATEDIRFHEHAGIDFKAVLSIPWYLIRGSKRGGSTLTQQLAKNLFKTRKNESLGIIGGFFMLKPLIVKMKEWIIAIQLEKSYTKKEIMTMYLNTVSFGNNATGIKAAARTFFSTSPDSLETHQAALLVGVLKATTYYNPFRNPKNAKKRRNTVLFQMQKYNYISGRLYRRLSATGLDLNYYEREQEDGNGSYYRQIVSSFMREWCKKNGYDLYSDGLKVYITIDSRMQKLAEEAMIEHMSFLQERFYEHWEGENPWVDNRHREIPNYIAIQAKRTSHYKTLQKRFGEYHDSIGIIMRTPRRMKVFSWGGVKDTVMSPIDSIKYYKHFLHTGMMTTNPRNGHIKVWIGDIDFRFFKYDNVSQSKRQPGSTFKPFVYTTAIDSMGYTPCSKFIDEKVIIRYEEDGEQKVWAPHNADWVFSGDTMSLRHALGRSINTVTAQLTEKIGWENVARYAKKMGIESEVAVVPSIGLGSGEVTLKEMVGAYGVFLNEGYWTEPILITRIADRNGKTLKRFFPRKRKAISEESAWLMTYMLLGALYEPEGTSRRLYSYNIFGNGNQVTGKTGTSSYNADGWYMGMTKDLVTGVWVGGDDRSIHFRTSEYGRGSRMALPIFGKFLEKAYADDSLGLSKGPFPQPGIEISKPYYCPTPEKPDSLEADTIDVQDVIQMIKDSNGAEKPEDN